MHQHIDRGAILLCPVVLGSKACSRSLLEFCFLSYLLFFDDLILASFDVIGWLRVCNDVDRQIQTMGQL